MKKIEYKIKKIANNHKYTNNLGQFKTKAEADRYQILYDLQQQKIIHDLQRNAVVTLLKEVKVYKYERKVLKYKTKTAKKRITVEKATTLTVNFIYKDKKGRLKFEVVKSPKEYKDPTYILKRKLMRYLFQIKLIEN